MTWKEIFDYVANNGFAIAVAVYCLWVQYKKIDNIEDALVELRTRLACVETTLEIR